MPDSWAISQLFPVIPLSQLNDEPVIRAVIEDITCDSDGIITNYMDHQGNEPSLKLPIYNPKTPYLLGVFLVGAYQEIMGNMHNLFGKVATLDICLDGKGNFEIEEVHAGFMNKDSLEHVGYDINEMLDTFKKSIATLKVAKAEQIHLLNLVKEIFDSHTYLR